MPPSDNAQADKFRELDRLRRVHLRAAQFGQGVGYGDGVDAAIR